MRRLPITLFFFSALAATVQAASLSGRIVADDSNTPVASVDVKLSKTGQQRLVADLDTDTSGHFHVPGLKAGEYKLEFSKNGYIGLTLQVQIADDSSDVTHQYRMIKGAVISGTATDFASRPIPGGFVYIMRKQSEDDSYRPLQRTEFGGGDWFASTDVNGRFRAYNLPPGQYALALAWGATRQHAAQHGDSAALPGFGTGMQFYPGNSAPTIFTITGGEQLQANFLINAAQSYTISGKIDREFKKGDGRYWLALLLPEQPGLAVASAQTDPTGAFKFEGMAAGTYDLVASGPSNGYGGIGGLLDAAPLFVRTRVTVSGQNVEGLTLAPAAPRSASFVVKRTDNLCPDVAEVTLTSAEDWNVGLTATKSIGPKAQTIDQLAPARYRITASTPDNVCYAVPRTVLVGENSALTEITLSPAGAIHGTLRGAADTTQFLAVLTNPEFPNDPVRVAHPDAKGVFEFPALRPGRYSIVAASAAESSRSRWVANAGTRLIDVTPGATVATDLTVPDAQ